VVLVKKVFLNEMVIVKKINFFDWWSLDKVLI
jgi:hypothetical protein